MSGFKSRNHIYTYSSYHQSQCLFGGLENISEKKISNSITMVYRRTSYKVQNVSITMRSASLESRNSCTIDTSPMNYNSLYLSKEIIPEAYFPWRRMPYTMDLGYSVDCSLSAVIARSSFLPRGKYLLESDIGRFAIYGLSILQLALPVAVLYKAKVERNCANILIETLEKGLWHLVNLKVY